MGIILEDLLFESVRYSVHSNSFDVSRLADYSLHLRVHQSCLAIGVYDPENNECLALESYGYETAMNTTALIVNLHNIVQKHSFLNAAFWKNVNIISALPSFAFIPSEIEGEDNDETILSLTSKFSSKEDKIFKNTTSLNASILFTLPQELENWFFEMYSNSNLSFSHSMESFIPEAFEFDSHSLHCYLDSDMLYLTKCNEEKQVTFANSFKYKTEQDLLYYVLFVIDELKGTPQDTTLTIWGEVKTDNTAIATLRKFIGKVNTGKKPKDMLYAYQFDQEPHEHAAVDIIGNMKLNR
ncbi:DUF3822 family protein [Flammeovirga pectinis]|uniref:DUF3822 family protein n=1 Tax=Flammeovirga pectinis TaxID=2494373 RepID=A0A3Q9FLM2_9BACT|nr:DUF3822 family protein [Flammeovirga pectinis]